MSIVIQTKCPWCGETSDVTITLAGYNARAAGAKIQEAFPELSASDREKLITGICPVCWDTEFADDEEMPLTDADYKLAANDMPEKMED